MSVTAATLDFEADAFDFTFDTVLFNKKTAHGNIFNGTDGNDMMRNNGSDALVSGLQGDDNISGGITRTTNEGWVIVYGGQPVVGATAEERNHDGNDTLEGGEGQRLNGGSDHDTYIVHGGAFAKTTTFKKFCWIPSFDQELDHLFVERDSTKFKDGISFGNIQGTVFNNNGDKFVRLESVQLYAHSDDNLFPIQNVLLQFKSDNRGVHTPYDIEFTGASYRDEVITEIRDQADDGWLL